MPVVVQKYGGSSLAGADQIRAVARRIGQTYRDGNSLVVVCSAMGKTTDELLALAGLIAVRPDRRELDVLLSTGEMVSCALVAMALQDAGYLAVSLTGLQAGIRTEEKYGKARIADVSPYRILREIEEGKIVVVCGFQGVTEGMDTTTLGRGGSDTTAVALAAALQASKCEIYTDVEGIYSADPRIVAQASKLPEINYEEMLELAQHGAKMEPRSIELGELYNVPIVVASSFGEEQGTLIHREVSMELRNRVRGVTCDLNVAKITVRGISDRPGVAATIFEPLTTAGISVDTIVQNSSMEDLTDLSFTVTRTDLSEALEVTKHTLSDVAAQGIASDDSLAKVSIVGTGMQNAPGYAGRMFRAMADANINIEMITTSEIRITCITSEAQAHDAVKVLHHAFELDEEPTATK